MIKNDSPSITLDEADQKKLALVQNRLTVLQGEVLEATKTLDAIEKAIEQGQKNKEYYDTLIESLKPQVDALQKRSEELKNEITTSEDTLRAHIDSHVELTSHFDTKKRQHDERESSISKHEAEHVETSVSLSKEKTAIEQERADLIRIRTAFLEAAQLMD